MLRKFLLVIPFILLLVVGTTYAQSSESEGILFQAVAKDFQGNAAGERSINVRLELLKNAANGAVEYQEKLEVISDVNGIFSVVIGRGEQIGGLFSFSELDWSVTSYFLHVEIAISPTIFSPEWDLEKEYKDLGTTKLWSVPYALSSKSAELATTLETVLTPDLGGTGLDNGENRLKLEGNLSVIGSGDVNFYVDAGSSITLPLNGTIATLEGEESLLNKTLTNPVITSPEFIGVIEVPYPSGQNENEAVNSKYLNEELSKINSEVSQNTTEISSNNSSIEENQDAISSNTTLINTLESSKLSLLGGTMTGAIDMGANSISNLKAPTSDSDAANKGYVDNAVENVDITKLELTLAQNQIFVGNSSEKALAVDLNGDASLTSTGTITINNNVVTTVKILDANVTTTKIADANVTEAKLADDAVTTVKILDANVTTTKIADANVTEAKLADDAVTTVKILDANVTTTKIADANVTEAKLADDAVTTVKILDANVTNAKLAKGIDAEKLADGSVDNSELQYIGNLTSDAQTQLDAKLALAGGTMTGAIDMGSNSISNLKAPTSDSDAANKGYVDLSLSEFSISLPETKLALAGGTMTGAIDMGSNSISNLQTPTDNSDAANKSYVDTAVENVDITKLELTLAQNQIFVGNSSEKALAVDLNGDASLTSTGTLTINNNVVTTVKILDANVTNAKLDKTNIPLSGFGAATADVALGANKLTGVSDPTAAQDAATKAYVDAANSTNADLTGMVTSSGNTTTVVTNANLTGDVTSVGNATTIGADKVTTTEILDATIVDADVSATAEIGINKLANGTTGQIMISDGTDNAFKSLAGDVTLANTGAVTIANDAVTTVKILDTNVTNDKIATGIDAEKLADGSVDNSELQYIGNLTSDAQTQLDAKLALAGGTMTGAIDMGSNSISNLQTPTDNSDAANKSYVDNAVENVDITKLELTLAQNQIFVGNSSEKALAVDLNGDASLTSTGTLTINNNVVTTVKILDANVTTAKIADANVTEAKLADDAVTTVKILDANVTTAKIADANVTEAKLADDAVTTVKILDANVTTTKIADANVTEAKLAVDAVTTVKILDANVTTAKIADANVTEAKLAGDAVTTVKILDTNVTNAKLAKGIDAEKLADGSVDNSELQYIGNLTSDAQTQLDAKLALAGGTMTGAIDMGSNSISNLQTPTDNSDAANKSYVDNAVENVDITKLELTLAQNQIFVGNSSESQIYKHRLLIYKQPIKVM